LLISKFRFRWVFCQLEVLRRCLLARIRQALEEIPESLDGTYERILQDIDKANWKFALHLFQCVTAASRPLRIEELAEFLVFDFDAGPTPTFQAGWRPADPIGAVLSTCSSLLAVLCVTTHWPHIYTILSLLSERIPNVHSPCRRKQQYFPLSRLYDTSSYNHGTSLPGHSVTPMKRSPTTH
jgi:hypothetical protein